jgi:hypothetical protein
MASRLDRYEQSNEGRAGMASLRPASVDFFKDTPWYLETDDLSHVPKEASHRSLWRSRSHATQAPTDWEEAPTIDPFKTTHVLPDIKHRKKLARDTFKTKTVGMVPYEQPVAEKITAADPQQMQQSYKIRTKPFERPVSQMSTSYSEWRDIPGRFPFPGPVRPTQTLKFTAENGVTRSVKMALPDYEHKKKVVFSGFNESRRFDEDNLTYLAVTPSSALRTGSEEGRGTWSSTRGGSGMRGKQSQSQSPSAMQQMHSSFDSSILLDDVDDVGVDSYDHDNLPVGVEMGEFAQGNIRTSRQSIPKLETTRPAPLIITVENAVPEEGGVGSPMPQGGSRRPSALLSASLAPAVPLRSNDSSPTLSEPQDVRRRHSSIAVSRRSPSVVSMSSVIQPGSPAPIGKSAPAQPLSRTLGLSSYELRTKNTRGMRTSAFRCKDEAVKAKPSVIKFV